MLTTTRFRKVSFKYTNLVIYAYFVDNAMNRNMDQNLPTPPEKLSEYINQLFSQFFLALVKSYKEMHSMESLEYVKSQKAKRERVIEAINDIKDQFNNTDYDTIQEEDCKKWLENYKFCTKSEEIFFKLQKDERDTENKSSEMHGITGKLYLYPKLEL